MTQDRQHNLAASVRQRLMNLAKEHHDEFGLILTRFGLERLLYRLAQSSHNDRFVLKGAMLFQLWNGNPHRPTRDLDLLGYGSSDPEYVQSVFRDICEQEVADDGLVFSSDSVRVEAMKEHEEYAGVRVKLQVNLASARIAIQIDIGFGDAVTPAPSDIVYPTLLDFPAPQVKAYGRETVVAEKYQAMVKLGIANSRMKDFYDIWTLASQHDFSGRALSAAIRATFERRQTILPHAPPLALTSEFSEDRQKLTQWQAFIRKGKLDGSNVTLSEVANLLRDFLLPPTQSLILGTDFDANWSAGAWK